VLDVAPMVLHPTHALSVCPLLACTNSLATWLLVSWYMLLQLHALSACTGTLTASVYQCTLQYASGVVCLLLSDSSMYQLTSNAVASELIHASNGHTDSACVGCSTDGATSNTCTVCMSAASSSSSRATCMLLCSIHVAQLLAV